MGSGVGVAVMVGAAVTGPVAAGVGLDCPVDGVVDAAQPRQTHAARTTAGASATRRLVQDMRGIIAASAGCDDPSGSRARIVG